VALKIREMSSVLLAGSDVVACQVRIEVSDRPVFVFRLFLPPCPPNLTKNAAVKRVSVRFCLHLHEMDLRFEKLVFRD
jgi:hypothetical protein